MKITSFRDLESYIYSSVILPFKDLRVDNIHYESPLQDGSSPWIFAIRSEEVSGEFHHNFQRDRAREQAKSLVMLKVGGANLVVADYDHSLRKVTIYRGAFDGLDKGNYLLKRLEEAFRSNTPFEKVVIDEGTRSVAVYIPQEDPERDEMPLSSLIWGDEDEEDERDEDEEDLEEQDIPF